MSVEIKEVRLGDICIKIGSGATPSGGKETYLSKGDFALIRSQNVLDFSFSYNGLAYINTTQASKLNNVTVETEDVLLNITGDSVARVCQVPDEILPARVNQHVAIIRPKKEKLDATFLKYYLLNPSFKNFMLGLSAVGATRNALTKVMIEDFKLNLPLLPIQCSIASILSSLDDKIQLNRQTIQTLEAIAQALFKEWFVDFNFPGTIGEMLESELGEIPKGWKVGTVGDLFELQRGFDLPSTTRTPGTVPVIAASGFNGYHNEFKIKSPGITTGRSGVLGNVFYIQEDFWPLNTSLFIKKFKEATPLFSFFILRNIDLKGMNGGSAVPTLNRNEVHKIKSIIPAKNLIDRFERISIPLFQQIKNNEEQSKTLIQLRDNLLPKLMKGEIALTKKISNYV